MRVNVRKNDLDDIVVEGIVTHAEAGREPELGGDVAGRHHDSHGDGLACGDEVVEYRADAAPPCSMIRRSRRRRGTGKGRADGPSLFRSREACRCVCC